MPTLKGRLMRAFGMRSTVFGEVPGRDSAAADHDKPVGVLSGCFWMVRRSALNDVGLLDEGFFMYAEDTDWCKRFWNAQWKVVYVPEATAIHYGGGSSAKTPVRSYIEMHRANLRYWRKHHGSLGQVSVHAIMLLHQVLRILGGGILFLTLRSRRESIRPIVRRSVACLSYLCGRVRPNVV
jgi:GT2 family glycosyltransferase